jgi:hypothetical protein
MTTDTALRCEAVAVDPRWWDCPALDTEQHIENSLGLPLQLPDHLEDALQAGWASEHAEALQRWFARRTHSTYEQVHRDNTYNSDNDFGSNFVFSVFAPVDSPDWLWAHDIFVVVEIHQGGDVRGNYGPALVYQVDCLAETGFLDWVCGWFASPLNSASENLSGDSDHPELRAANDRLSIGYSSHPTSELRGLLWQGTEPAWSYRHRCHVGRLADVPFPVRLTPTAPYYC